MTEKVQFVRVAPSCPNCDEPAWWDESQLTWLCPLTKCGQKVETQPPEGHFKALPVLSETGVEERKVPPTLTLYDRAGQCGAVLPVTELTQLPLESWEVNGVRYVVVQHRRTGTKYDVERRVWEAVTDVHGVVRLSWEGQDASGWIVREVVNCVPGKRRTRDEFREVNRHEHAVLLEDHGGQAFRMHARHWDQWQKQGTVVELKPPTVDIDVVQVLEKMLEDAKSGELVALAYVVAYRGKGRYSRGLYGKAGEQQLLFGLESLKYRIVKEAEER
jgi:hypothetical protein